jgi:beta-N-acetylhexosaminidase
MEKAQLLLSLGLNVNLAPVCDLSADSSDFMYKRSLGGGNVDTYCEFVRDMVNISKQEASGCVLKHFPGYGGGDDSHKGSSPTLAPRRRFAKASCCPLRRASATGPGL